MDPAEEDREGHEEGATEIPPSGTFSDAALALPPGRTATFSSWPSGPNGSTPRGPSLGGSADGASLLSARAGSASGTLMAALSRSGHGGAASGAEKDEDETSAFGGGGGGRAQIHHGLLQHGACRQEDVPSDA